MSFKSLPSRKQNHYKKQRKQQNLISYNTIKILNKILNKILKKNLNKKLNMNPNRNALNPYKKTANTIKSYTFITLNP